MSLIDLYRYAFLCAYLCGSTLFRKIYVLIGIALYKGAVYSRKYRIGGRKVKEDPKTSSGSPPPSVWTTRARTARYLVGPESIKDREVLNRPLTEAQIRGIAPPAPVLNNSPILEAS